MPKCSAKMYLFVHFKYLVFYYLIFADSDLSFGTVEVSMRRNVDMNVNISESKE